MWNSPSIFISFALIALALWQVWVVGGEYLLRRRRYNLAKEAAARRGKPLLVVGRPGGRLRVYGEGDVTLDLDPKVLTDCPQSGIVGNACSMPFRTKQFGAVFSSHVLDCLPSPEAAEHANRELRRVANEVYVCATSPLNLYWRWLSPEINVWVELKGNQVILREHPRQGFRRRLARLALWRR